MRYIIGFVVLGTALAGLLFFWETNKVFEISTKTTAADLNLTVPEAPIVTSSIASDVVSESNSDIEPQKPLPNPPAQIHAIYLTSWSAGSEKKIGQIIDLIRGTSINAVVIDIKDYSGYVTYDSQVPEVEKYNAKELRIPKLNALIKRLHDENIYAIGRITVFQDPRLAKARPDLAIQSVSKGAVWHDSKGLAWIDPASKDAWDYIVKIAKDASSRGFDELNFDYIRFASDGNLRDMKFPFWNGKTPKNEIIREFFQYLRGGLTGTKISADVFGIITVRKDDLGIGQIIEDAYQYFDYVMPMVYPSHWASGSFGFKNPALYPYEVVKYSIEEALARLNEYNSPPKAAATSSVITASNSSSSGRATVDAKVERHGESQAKIRPWLQDFDLGAIYNPPMVKKQISAVYDVFCQDNTSSTAQAQTCENGLGGWSLWNPSNSYLKAALEN